jgi:hypothetical protein
MQFYNLFPLLEHQIMNAVTLCELCSTESIDLADTPERQGLLNIISAEGFHPLLQSTGTAELYEIVQIIQKDEFFNNENDDDDIPDDSDLAFMSTSNQSNSSWEDVIFQGPPEFQKKLRQICSEHSRVFAYKVGATAADVPPLHFDYNKAEWHRAANRLAQQINLHRETNSIVRDVRRLPQIRGHPTITSNSMVTSESSPETHRGLAIHHRFQRPQ